MKTSKVRQNFKILSSAAYLPGKKVSAHDIQEKMAVDANWILKKTGVEHRYFAEDETIASMGAKALKVALERAGLGMSEFDLLIAAGGTPDQPIPHNSALIHHELGLDSSVTAFDVDATCLSFVQALNVASSMLAADVYKRIVIVSSEKPSVGLDYECPDSAALLGDGAVAFVLEKTEEDKGILFAEFSTHSELAHLTEIPAGGTRLHPKDVAETGDSGFLFKMDGKNIYKKASEILPDFYLSTLEKHGFVPEDFRQVIPHQASMLALGLIRKKLRIPADRFFINIHKYGNLVAASIPLALHEAMEQDLLKEGDQALFLATAAGLTLGFCGIKL